MLKTIQFLVLSKAIGSVKPEAIDKIVNALKFNKENNGAQSKLLS